jgi:hypothetical protein
VNSLVLWQIVGWALLAVILLGILWLSYALYADSKRTKERSISLPSLNPQAEAGSKQDVFEAVPDKLVEGNTRSSRRARRNESKEDYQERLATKSSSFFDDDDAEEFNITSGRD